MGGPSAEVVVADSSGRESQRICERKHSSRSSLPLHGFLTLGPSMVGADESFFIFVTCTVHVASSVATSYQSLPEWGARWMFSMISPSGN